MVILWFTICHYLATTDYQVYKAMSAARPRPSTIAQRFIKAPCIKAQLTNMPGRRESAPLLPVYEPRDEYETIPPQREGRRPSRQDPSSRFRPDRRYRRLPSLAYGGRTHGRRRRSSAWLIAEQIAILFGILLMAVSLLLAFTFFVAVGMPDCVRHETETSL